MSALSAASPAPTPGPEAIATRLRSHLVECAAEMEGALERVARTESPTTAPETQRPVQDLLAELLEPAGYRFRRIAGQETGGHLLAVPQPRPRAAPYQLVVGHADTVWPLGTLERMPVVNDGQTIRGPGTFDMKAGLIQGIFALRALRDLGLEPEATPVYLITSDEEIGSPESERHIIRLARGACRALVLEPALGRDGIIKTTRKGAGQFDVRVIGKSAHGGLAPESGASAILELANVIQALHGLADPDRGITVNVGVIEGGVRPNVVAPDSRAEVDVRVRTLADARRMETAIGALEATVPGTRLEISGEIGRAPMEQTPRNLTLWEAARRAGESLGLELGQGESGGASDGNITSLYTATLDGLGAVGDGAHADHEFVSCPDMVERSALLGMILLLPARLGGPDLD